MKTTVLALSVLALCALAMPAQQQNSFIANMTFNGLAGNPVPAPRGYPVAAVISSGLQYKPFIVAFSPTMVPNGFPWGPNLVDLSPTGMSFPFNGLVDPIFNTGATGTFTANFTIAATTPLNAATCWQTAIANAGSPVGASLTAATRLLVTAGITSTSLSLGDDQSVAYSVASFGMTLPFYAQNYSAIQVHSNGEICFGSGNSDFTPTTSEFISQMPRICGDWTDLSPNTGGTVTVVVDQAVAPGFVRVNFNNVPEFGAGANHTFSMKIWAAPLGDVEIWHSAFSTMGFYDLLVGITAGSNLGPQNAANPMKDLSTMNINPIVGAANENFHEWFGQVGGAMPYYQPTPLVSRAFDLSGTTQTFYAIGAGAAGAAYMGTSQ